MPIMNMMPGGAGVRIPLEAPTDIAFDVHTGEVRLSWTDPVDKYATPGGELVAEWSHTLIVRKEGSAPTSPLDGVQVFKSTTRDAYRNAYYSDSGLTNGTQYYYALYAYTTLGVYSEPLLGTATPISGLLTYHGTVTPFAQARANYGAAVAGNQYAVFVGGNNYHSDMGSSNLAVANVDAYSTSLSRISVDNVPDAVVGPAATSFRNYSVFGGGTNGNFRGKFSVFFYNESLTYTSALEGLSPSHPTYGTWAHCSAGANSNYVLFAGGFNLDGSYRQKHVVGYDRSFTKVASVSELDFRASDMASITRDENIVFAGGTFDAGDRALNDIHIYDSSLTYTYKSFALSEKKGYMGTALAGDYIVFGGGTTYNIDNYEYAVDTVEAYDSSFTRTIPTSLTSVKNRVYATSLGKYAIFGGGMTGSRSTIGQDLAYKTVDAYDSSLTKTIAHDLSTERYAMQAVTVGNYAIFGSGWEDTSLINSGSLGTSMDAFTLE